MEYEKRAKRSTTQLVNKLRSQTIHFQLVYLLEELYRPHQTHKSFYAIPSNYATGDRQPGSSNQPGPTSILSQIINIQFSACVALILSCYISSVCWGYYEQFRFCREILYAKGGFTRVYPRLWLLLGWFG